MEAKRLWAEYAAAREVAALVQVQVGWGQGAFLRAMTAAKQALQQLRATRARHAEAVRRAGELLERARAAQSREDAQMRRSA